MAETESENFKVLNEAHVSLLLKVDKLNEQRSESAECVIALESDLYSANQNIERLLQSERSLQGKVSDLENERKAEARALDVLKSEHHLVKLENGELHKLRTADAEKFQSLFSELQAAKMELASIRKEQVESAIRDKSLSMELTALREERQGLIKQHDQMKEGVTTLFEFIRRNKVNDDRGMEIPNIRGVFPNIFRNADQSI